MSDKELIKQEIEKRLSFLWNLIPEGEKVLKDDFTKEDANNLGKYTELESLLKFIDSLPEEPASDDLEEAANFYANTNIEWFDSEGNPCVMPAFKAGAEWQEKKMLGIAEAFYEQGRFEQKQEMMKDAVNGTVKYEIGSAVIPQCDKRYQVLSDQVYIPNAKLGDKVKIIVLKTE